MMRSDLQGIQADLILAFNRLQPGIFELEHRVAFL
jgi:hypothetical protein